jgi:probable HAF family extracellular repeat protein
LTAGAAACGVGLVAGGAAWSQNCDGQYSCAVESSGGNAVNLGGLPGTTGAAAYGVNDIGQVVGQSGDHAVEWRDGSVISLGAPPGSTGTVATAINDAGQVVGTGDIGGASRAIEWSGGAEIVLPLSPGTTGSAAYGLDSTGHIVGSSVYAHSIDDQIGNIATEWTGGTVITLGGLPGSADSVAYGVDNAGEIVGKSQMLVNAAKYDVATEWNDGEIIDLGALPGTASSAAYAINNSGEIVGQSGAYAAEWIGGKVIDLGALPGSVGSIAYGINDAGQVVGMSQMLVHGIEFDVATEWSDGEIIDLGSLGSVAYGINDVGQVIRDSFGAPTTVAEPSTWAMMLVGFAGLGFAGYRKARGGLKCPRFQRPVFGFAAASRRVAFASQARVEASTRGDKILRTRAW